MIIDIKIFTLSSPPSIWPQSNFDTDFELEVSSYSSLPSSSDNQLAFTCWASQYSYTGSISSWITPTASGTRSSSQLASFVSFSSGSVGVRARISIASLLGQPRAVFLPRGRFFDARASCQVHAWNRPLRWLFFGFLTSNSCKVIQACYSIWKASLFISTASSYWGSICFSPSSHATCLDQALFTYSSKASLIF